MRTRNCFKRPLAFLLSAALLFTFQLPLQANGATLSDIKGHWAENYINRAVNYGFVLGYPNGTFVPDKPVTRAEFTKMVNSALGNSGTANLSFTDVPYYEWYYDQVGKAVSAAYVTGYEDNTFRPANNITRQEAAVMIARLVPTYGASKSITGYGDYSSISDWARSALIKVTGKGYLGPYSDGLLHPTDKLSRAQAAKIIVDILEKETIVASDPRITADGTTLSNRIYVNNVTITKDLGEGNATLNNSVVLGTLQVLGGGSSSVTLTNSRIANVSVNKSDTSVRVIARGETSIPRLSGLQAFALETASLAGGTFGTGFERISLGGSASATLSGSFPLVIVDGSASNLNLASGTIDQLTVNSSGRRSNITVGSNSTIRTATLNGESYFHGTGTINSMLVYASGVTYETKPRSISVGSGGSTPTQVDPVLDVAFSPVNAATNVYMDAKVTLTFSTAMRLANGNAITSSNISDFVELRSDSQSGTKVSFTAAIDSAKKVITLTPTSSLTKNTRYYIVLKGSTLLDTYGNVNAAKSSYFNTGDATQAVTVVYSPVSGATAVPVTTKTFTISFSDSLVKYSGSAFSSDTDSYLESDVVYVKRGTNSSNQATVANSEYSTKIDSNRRIITITMNSNLNTSSHYTVGINASKMKTAYGTVVAGSSATWSTAGGPTLSSPSVAENETSLVLTVTPNVEGTIYAVAVTSGAVAPTAASIAAGKDGSGIAAAASRNLSVTTFTAKDLTLSGLARDTAYKVYAVLYDGAGNYSTVVADESNQTKRLSLNSLTVTADTGVVPLSPAFSQATTSYTVIVPKANTSVTIAATTTDNLPISVNGSTTSGIVTLTGTTTPITIVAVEPGTTNPVEYTVNVLKQGDASLSMITAGAATLSGGSYSSGSVMLISSSEAISLQIAAVDSEATISVSGAGVTWNGSLSGGVWTLTDSLTLTTTDTAITFTIADLNISATYNIVLRQQ